MDSNLVSLVDRAAQSILESDRAKCAPNGQRLGFVRSVSATWDGDVDMVAVVLDGDGGASARSLVIPTGFAKPGNRALAAADVHDAVATAVHQAAASMAVPS